MHEETVTARRGKDRKERNLASSRDRVAGDSHHHRSSGIPLVWSVSVHRWWGSPHCLVSRPLIRCLGRLLPRQWHVPHVPPIPCMFFFSVLDPAGQGGGCCLDMFSTTIYPCTCPLRLVLGGLFLDWFLFDWPARGSSWAPNKVCWPARRSCSKLCKQALKQLS